MAIVDEERRKMLCAQSIGPRMIGYLEIIGIERLADLRGQNAGEIAVRINAALWRDHITCRG